MIRRARPLLGTFVEMTADFPDRACGTAALEKAFSDIETVQGLMSRFDPESDISKINAHAGAQPVRVHPWTFKVLSLAQSIQEQSDGAFDIRRGSRKGSIKLDQGRSVFIDTPGTEIDLGGIAKGFAVDVATEALQKCGAVCGLVNAGGDLRAFGNRDFHVGIRNPAHPTQITTSLNLRNQALANSGNYYGHHIRQHVRSPLRSYRATSVLSETCVIADALTKVCMFRAPAMEIMLERYRAYSIVFE